MRKILCIALAAAMVMPYGYSVFPEKKEGPEPEDKLGQYELLKENFLGHASTGNLSEVKALIKEDLKKITPELTDPEYGVLDDAITAAIDNGHTKVVEYLIKTKNAEAHAIKVTAEGNTNNEVTIIGAAQRGVEKFKNQAKGKPDIIKVLDKELKFLDKLLKKIEATD